MAGLSIQDLLDNENLDALSKETQGNPIPVPLAVEGRVADIDGDYLAYIVAADRKDQEPTTLPQAIKHLNDFVDQLMKYSGSTDFVIHLTEGDKGGRYKQAKLKEYQANRLNKEPPLLLGDVRRHIAASDKSYVCTTGEADDSMAMELYKARQRNQEHLRVLISQDKDLNMARGWHLDWANSTLYYVGDLGELRMEEKVGSTGTRTKKLRGTGGLWFFAQLLTGDAVDNISGLPKLVGSIMNIIKPTKPITKAFAVLSNPKSTEAQMLKANDVLLSRNGGLVGAVTAYEFLKDCKTLSAAYLKVLGAYMAYGEQYGFEDYNGDKISVIDAFESECRLLYMRHNLDSEDFRLYLNKIITNKM